MDFTFDKLPIVDGIKFQDTPASNTQDLESCTQYPYLSASIAFM